MIDGALIDEDMVVRAIELDCKQVVYVKSIVQASEGLCCLIADRSRGPILLVAPREREADLDRLVDDLLHELGPDLMTVRHDQGSYENALSQ
jgi:hypothetical protein